MPSGLGVGVFGTASTVSSPQSYSFLNTSGTILYVVIGLGVNTGGTTAFGTVTYGGITMTNVFEATTVSGASRIGLFRLTNPPLGTNTVQYSFSMTPAGANHTAAWSGAISWRNVDLANPEVQSAGVADSDAFAVAGISGVLAVNATLGFAGAGSDFISASGGTQTFIGNIVASNQLGNGIAAYQQGAVNFVTHAFDITTADSWVAGVVELRAATALEPTDYSKFPKFRLRRR